MSFHANVLQMLAVEKYLKEHWDDDARVYRGTMNDRALAKIVTAETSRELSPAAVSRHRLETGRTFLKRGKPFLKTDRVAVLERQVLYLFTQLGIDRDAAL